MNTRLQRGQPQPTLVSESASSFGTFRDVRHLTQRITS
jgi:hypothetical protein